ncbi:MAG: hypothetical protein L6Q54_05565 [Leptospiraceae bacterium]|nr:hypothetical protein [Leptospiraceae bacterium]MCK6380706.1 hypothetical protein [Leptospiraceae bacterium]NUM41250.1 hypothetical protein [Leptospiraceae bacterium]
MKIKLTLTLVVIGFWACTSPQERASKTPVKNVCPDLGKLDEKQINPEAMFQDEHSREKLIAVQTKGNGIKFYDSYYFFNALKITEKFGFDKFTQIYLEVCGGESPNINSIPFVISEKEKRERFAKEETEWKKILKSKNLKTIYDWNPSEENTDLKKIVDKDWSELVNAKVLKYCKKTFPAFASKCEMSIVDSGGDTGYQLYHLFRISALARNPNTGEKIGKEEQKLISTNLGLEVYFNNDGREVSIVFKEFSRKLAIKGIKANGDYNPNGWEFLKNPLFESLSQYPKSDSWDFEFIDKI